MSRGDKDALAQPSIDSILRSLTDRPNVQATLILSRKDGSIIKGSGFLSHDKPKAEAASGEYQWQEPPKEAETDLTNDDAKRVSSNHESRGKAEEITSITAAETLAASVFNFVNLATSLGASVGSASRGATKRRLSLAGGSETTKAQVMHKPGGEDGQEDWYAEDEMQLLRLRTREQEIIIFPDPRYLCCVVQKLTRSETAGSSR